MIKIIRRFVQEGNSIHHISNKQHTSSQDLSEKIDYINEILLTIVFHIFGLLLSTVTVFLRPPLLKAVMEPRRAPRALSPDGGGAEEGAGGGGGPADGGGGGPGPGGGGGGEMVDGGGGGGAGVAGGGGGAGSDCKGG